VNVSELNFEPNDLYFGSSIVNDEFNTDSSNLKLINEFFETTEEPIPTGRIYKGSKYSSEFEFGLVREKSNEIVFEDENYLVGFEPDDRRYYKEAYE
tara:strand:+ start:37 stop:327 length:291 start_codon:yes stop_codon:yes gene_type:complete